VKQHLVFALIFLKLFSLAFAFSVFLFSVTSSFHRNMTSTAAQPQFRYTQPPSRVLHMRNLPWECSEEELIELCKPFGKVVNTKVNVGANHNQAFVEFVSTRTKKNFFSYFFPKSGSCKPLMKNRELA
jgi:RNA recognition motif-containing protein